MQRDFTYIDDIVEGVVRVMGRLARPNPAWQGDDPDPGTSYAPYKIYNIGNNNPVELLEFIEEIELALGSKAQKEFLDLQPGDVPATYADVDDLIADVGFKPETPIRTGIQRFIEWYREYYAVE
jgi:UDP-glucuronate 4-epimerase